MELSRPGATTARLGSYEILSKFALGGMAELFLARSTGPQGFEKLVVLKKILPEYAANPRFVRLFLDEAKLVANLDHPHIAQVYDMGVVDGDYFFTMEYIHGRDVRSILRRAMKLGRTIPTSVAILVASSVAAALHYAHERRGPDGHVLEIVHRDVSPSNIVVSYDGAVKLLDFGVAKAATSTIKTRTGALKGKVSYMSPEQAKGADLDRRSDIFSLGIVLWEAITARRLFRGKNDLATIQQIINMPIPPCSLYVDTDAELEGIVAKALSRDIGRRYQTCRELLVDLEEYAFENKIKTSTRALGEFMGALFADEIGEWEEAQSAGRTLTEHVLSRASVASTWSEDEESGEVDHTATTPAGSVNHAEPPQTLSFRPAPELDAVGAPTRGRQWRWAVTGLVVALALGFAAVAATGDDPDSASGGIESSASEVVQPADVGAQALPPAPAIEPDAGAVAATDASPGVPEIDTEGGPVTGTRSEIDEPVKSKAPPSEPVKTAAKTAARPPTEVTKPRPRRIKRRRRRPKPRPPKKRKTFDPNAALPPD